MLSFKTTKEIPVSMHTDETSIVEFVFAYHRGMDYLQVEVSVFKVTPDPEEPNIAIPEVSTTRIITGDTLNGLMAVAKSMTTEVDDPLEYMDALVANGIKYIIVNEGLYHGSLSSGDFE